MIKASSASSWKEYLKEDKIEVYLHIKQPKDDDTRAC